VLKLASRKNAGVQCPRAINSALGRENSVARAPPVLRIAPQARSKTSKYTEPAMPLDPEKNAARDLVEVNPPNQARTVQANQEGGHGAERLHENGYL